MIEAVFFDLWLQIKAQSGYNGAELQMLAKQLIAPMALIFFLAAFPCGCKKTPTTDTIEPPSQQSISITCSPNSGGPDTVVTVAVLIARNSKEIRVFGFDTAFDTKMFEFQGVVKGSLTGSWAAVDGNEASPGELKVGGFVGSGTPVAANSSGSLVEIKFKVTGQTYGNDQQSQICIRSYTDDISGFTPNPACTTFTLKK
jgi:Cohesin domain